MIRAFAACAALAICIPAPERAWVLTAVVKDKDGKPSITSYGFGRDRQVCIAAMNAIKKMQPEGCHRSRLHTTEPQRKGIAGTFAVCDA